MRLQNTIRKIATYPRPESTFSPAPSTSHIGLACESRDRNDNKDDAGQEQQLLTHLATTQLLRNLQVLREDARRHAGSAVEASTTHPAGSVGRVPRSTSRHSSTAASPGRCRL